MKSHLLYIGLVIFCLFSGCKNAEDKSEETVSDEISETHSDKTAKQNDGLILFTGDFLYYDDAAVLNTGQNVYGVEPNDKMFELDSLVKPFKKEPTDMIHVNIRGKLKPKPENSEGWDYYFEIEEIIEVYPQIQADSDSADEQL